MNTKYIMPLLGVLALLAVYVSLLFGFDPKWACSAANLVSSSPIAACTTTTGTTVTNATPTTPATETPTPAPAAADPAAK